MTLMQKRAAAVCAGCALAIVVTGGVTGAAVITGRKKHSAKPKPTTPTSVVEEASEDVVDEVVVPVEVFVNEDYQVDTQSGAVLPEREGAGADYLKQTLFLGDSNTVRYYNNGLLSLQQFCAKEGLSIRFAASESFVTFKRDKKTYTIPQAVAKLKPRRVVIMLGTNDLEMDAETFIQYYKNFIGAIQESYPYTDIIVNTLPAIPYNHSAYPQMSQEKVDEFNMNLLAMCEEMGLEFLNSIEVLKDADGYGREEYYISGDIHLKSNGLKAILNYVSTHPSMAEDIRPDTKNIPTRSQEYTVSETAPVVASSTSSSVASSSASSSSSSSASSTSSSSSSSSVSSTSSASSTSSSSSSSSSASSAKEEAASSDKKADGTHTAEYTAEKGGTLSSGNKKGKASLSFSLKSAEDVTVIAVPDKGYVFVRWSDGNTAATRTDASLKEDLSVSAIFASGSIKIAMSNSFFGSTAFQATMTGDYLTSRMLRWYLDGKEIKAAAGQTNCTVVLDDLKVSHTVYASATYNGTTITSNTVTIAAAEESKPVQNAKEEKTNDEKEAVAEGNEKTASSSDEE